MTPSLLSRVSSLAVIAMISACIPKQPGAVSAASPSGPVGGSDTIPGKPCPAEAKIDDGEDQDGQVIVQDGRGGYVYTYVDKLGSKIAPEGEEYRMAEGGANGTRYAIHASGTLVAGEEAHAGVGIDLRDPRKPYDASRYQGVTFFAKRGPGGAARLRVRFPDKYTDPSGKKCKDCYNDFHVDIELTDQWKRYDIAFSTLRQEEGWGDPRPEHVATKKLYALQFVPAGPGAFDFWLDELSFAGCK